MNLFLMLLILRIAMRSRFLDFTKRLLRIVKGVVYTVNVSDTKLSGLHEMLAGAVCVPGLD